MFKKKFKSRTKLDKNFMSLVYGWKYLKPKKEFISTSIKKKLIKFTKEFAIFQKVCFRCCREDCFICSRFKHIYKQYMYYIDNDRSVMLWRIYSKKNQYGFELKHII